VKGDRASTEGERCTNRKRSVIRRGVSREEKGKGVKSLRNRSNERG